MDPWLARAERLCYEGEEITDTVRLGEGGVVVTTHRVLAFSPHGDGANFQQADRPNVEDVGRDDGGDTRWLERGAKALVVGTILVIAGSAVDLEGMVGDVSLSSASGVAGIGSLLGLLQGLLAFLAVLDDLLVLAGGLALLVTVAAFGAYLWTRETTLRLAVAGGEDLAVSVEEWPADEDVLGRLRRAIAPASDGEPTGVRAGRRDGPLA
jgi:hypothetical protein